MGYNHIVNIDAKRLMLLLVRSSRFCVGCTTAEQESGIARREIVQLKEKLEAS